MWSAFTSSLFRWPALTLAIALFAGCGGGGGAPPEGAGAVVLSTYLTDDVSREHRQVWVQLLKIGVVDAAGNNVTVYEPTAGEAADPVNLSQLASVGQLLSQVSVPAGRLKRVRVTLGDRVVLVPRDGRPAIQATLGGDGMPVTLSLPVDVDAGAPTALLLDFDLARFTYDAATNRVVAALSRRDPRELSRLLRQQAELRGTVVSVGADRFVVDDRHLGAGVTVQLAADGVVFDETESAVADPSALKAGARVSGRVLVLPKARAGDPTWVQASLVRIEPPGDAAGARLQGRGIVTSLQRTGLDGGAVTTTATLELAEANFMPSTGSARVDLGQAVFLHGSLAEVAVGQQLAFLGSGTPAGVRALRARIDGAPSSRSRAEHPHDRFVEGEGVVQSVSGSTVVLAVNAASQRLAPGTYTLEAARALFEAGRPECLRPGAVVEAKGLLDATTQPNRTLLARVVAIEGGCAMR